jgi:hypothetical protein
MINIIKSQPAPACLAIERIKANGDYKCGDVLERIKTDFHNKCYICEDKEPTSINVEHFIPHKNRDKDLEFNWNNLFYACVHCNSTKHAKYNNLLNCIDPSHEILNWIKFEIKPFPKELANITAINTDAATVETVTLLNEVYNGTTELKTIEASNLRNKLLTEILDFQGLLFKYMDYEAVDAQYAADLLRDIKRRLHPTSAFVAFKVWIIKENHFLFQKFGEFINW